MRLPITAMFVALVLAVLGLTQPQPAHANVEDFSYDSWDTSIALSVGSDGRATAHVTETVVAKFPMTRQNKGIVRGLPLELHGAYAGPENITVTDGEGNPIPFSIEEEDGFRIILTGTDDYVLGAQTYVMSYDIPDPIFQPNDAQIDEFYWDMVSVDRLQPIETFTASVSLDHTLEQAFLHQAVAYVGSPGSRDTAELRRSENTITLAPMRLGPNEVVTFALGFASDTVVQPKARIPNFTLDSLPIVLGGAATLTAGSSILAIRRMYRRRRQTGRAIIAQYDVPATMPPLLAAHIRDSAPDSGITAQFLHLAVHGHIRIEERTKKDGALYATPRPVFRNLNLDVHPPKRMGDPLDAEAMTAIFGHPPSELFEIPKASSTFSSRMTKLAAKARTASDERGYFTKVRSRGAMILGWIAVGLLGATAMLLVASFSSGYAKDFTSFAFLLAALSIPLIIMSFVKHRVHTAKGAEAYEYLEGVKLFITVAEEARIAMLQSPSGAERRVEPGGTQVLHLYELLLPYAVLFGLEKEWSKVLATQYEAGGVTSPHWYPYLATRGIANLSDSVSSLTGRVSSAASYTASASSGSSGGGFAGGGGGGGFSGGR